MAEKGKSCRSCAEVILKEYFRLRDRDNDGVIIDIKAVIEEVKSGRAKSIEEAVERTAEFLPGSWLCKHLTFEYIKQEMDKGRKISEIVEEIKRKEPLRYRGCIKGEGVIYEVEEEVADGRSRGEDKV